MRPTAGVPDARPVQGLADQIRSDRHRRFRRRRAVLGALVLLPVAVFAARIASGSTAAGTGGAAASTSTTSTPTGLAPGLVDSFERARAEAADAGFELSITSGFRTAEEQAALLQAEIATRGSREEALWWVFPPERSMHVQGLAVDVGDGPAADWLAAAGVRFGLCQTLAWEWWHFEWRTRWEAAGACPAPARTPADAPMP